MRSDRACFPDKFILNPNRFSGICLLGQRRCWECGPSILRLGAPSSDRLETPQFTTTQPSCEYLLDSNESCCRSDCQFLLHGFWRDFTVQLQLELWRRCNLDQLKSNACIFQPGII